jgi:hypothetical protein
MLYLSDRSKRRNEREQGSTFLVVIWALSILIVLSLVFGRAFRVLAQARTAQGAIFVREAVVEFVSAGADGYMFRRWRKGLATDSGTVSSPADDHSPC